MSVDILKIFEELVDPLNYNEYENYCFLWDFNPISKSNYAYKVGSYELAKRLYPSEEPRKAYRKFHEQTGVLHDMVVSKESEKKGKKKCNCKKNKFKEGVEIK